MTRTELAYLIFELLHERLNPDDGETQAFVGIQGDNVIVMQPGGNHLAVSVVPATASVPG